MPIPVLLPVLGPSMTEGTVARWIKQQGEPVEKGEPLLSVEMDKATMDVEAPASGILARILVEQGETVPVQTVIAEIGNGVEHAPSPPTATITAPTPPIVTPAPPPPRPVALTRVTPTAAPGRLVASPYARAQAHRLGVDLQQVRGSGPGGRIVGADVHAAQPTMPFMPATASASSGLDVGMLQLVADVSDASDLLRQVDAALAAAEEPSIGWGLLVGRAVALARPPVPNDRVQTIRITHAGRDELPLELPLAALVDRPLAALRREAGPNMAGASGPPAIIVTDASGSRIDLLVPPPLAGASLQVGIGHVTERPAVRAGVIVGRMTAPLAVRYDPRQVQTREVLAFVERLEELLLQPYRLMLGGIQPAPASGG